MPAGAPSARASSELQRLIRAVTARMQYNSLSPDRSSAAACSTPRHMPFSPFFYTLPPLAVKARKVALSVRMYPPCSSAITRQAPIPALADRYQPV